MKKEINVGELYSTYPNTINKFYDYMDEKYSIVDYIDRFKQYLPNEAMYIRHLLEYFDSVQKFVYIKPMVDLESNLNFFKYCVNNVEYGTGVDRFDCEVKAIEKVLSMLENEYHTIIP